MKQGIHAAAAALLAVPILLGAVTIREPATSGCGLYYSDEVTASDLPVTKGAGAGFRTILRVVTDVQAGDLVEARGRWRAENRTGYLVGVGTHLWGYDLDGDRTVWWRLGPSNGINITPAEKYGPLYVDTVWQAPDDWPEGHRLVVVVRGDAHSTAARSGDALTVTVNGTVTVNRC